ncbi:MAG: sigma-54-dependent Fis family transcriptional regulator, partial [Gemmataceae bacterium]|nr:sigma-54-dependent Fis family transcriptional regulator [Gemmataceae bacterium]
ANAMEYAWIVSGGQPITPAHLPHDVRSPAGRAGGVSPLMPSASDPMAAHQGAHAPRSPSRLDPGHPPTVPFPSTAAGGGTKTLADIEMEYILQVYAKNNHNKQATSAELGISLKTLYNKLHRYEEERQQRAG